MEALSIKEQKPIREGLDQSSQVGRFRYAEKLVQEARNQYAHSA